MRIAVADADVGIDVLFHFVCSHVRAFSNIYKQAHIGTSVNSGISFARVFIYTTRMLYVELKNVCRKACFCAVFPPHSETNARIKETTV